MIWMQPPTQAFSPFTKLEYQRPNKFHLIGDWLSKTRWVALCDMKARQYDHFQPGEQADDPDDKCGRCVAIKRHTTQPATYGLHFLRPKTEGLYMSIYYQDEHVTICLGDCLTEHRERLVSA